MSVSTGYDYSTSTVQQRALEEKNSSYGTSSTDFLQLLIAQLTNQDPLNPMEDMDFTSQLAQLQSLEEQMAMTKSINAMRIDTQVQSATAMIGKEVTGIDSSGASVTGIVARVVQTSDNVFVELTGGEQIPVSNVMDISSTEGSAANQLSNAAGYIGMWVEAGTDSSGNAIMGIVQTVGVVDGKVALQLYGGGVISPDQVECMRAPTDNDVWYYYPDDVRENISLAQSMLALTVTGTSSAGEAVTGIVANATVDENNQVQLILFDGTLINVKDVDATRATAAADVIRDMNGLWATGLDENGQSVEGLIVGAEDREDGLAVLLEGGKYIYFDSLTDVSDAPESEPDPESETETEAADVDGSERSSSWA